MFRMREGLELSRVRRSPGTEVAAFVPCAPGDVGQEPCLGFQPFRPQAGHFTSGLDGRKIHVRREVLLADVAEHVGAEPVAVISA